MTTSARGPVVADTNVFGARLRSRGQRTTAECHALGHALAQKQHNADIWIAATAIHLNVPLVSDDGIFDGVPGLVTESVLLAPVHLRQAHRVDAAEQTPTTVDLTALHLDVYDTRDGPWNPEYGDIDIPADWEFLPSGDTFVTRTVKAGGRYWLAWRPRGRHRDHRRLLGLWAPAEAIRAAEQRAKETAARRAATRQVSARSRARHEERYQEQLRSAVLRFLNFAPAYTDLAEQIATETSAHAAVVGSSRVGRTQLLPLEEKAALAARAHIRHRCTAYEGELDNLPLEAWGEDDLYREIKGAAHEAVDEFLERHRQQSHDAG